MASKRFCDICALKLGTKTTATQYDVKVNNWFTADLCSDHSAEVIEEQKR